MNRKQKRINEIIDDAAKALDTEGVKYFIGVVDKQPTEADGGKVYAKSDVTGDDFCYILEVALPTRQDIINLGIWIGKLITAKSKT